MSRRRTSLVVLLILIAALAAVLLVLRPWRTEAPRAAARSVAPDAGARANRRPAATVPAAPGAPVDLAGPIALSAATVVAAPDATAGELAGRVLDWGSGAPVSGAEIAITSEDGGGTSSFVTDAAGRFVVRPPAPGRYRVVSALAADYLPWAPDPGASPLELVARPGLRVDGAVIYLVPAILYHGRVVDPDGAAVAGAAVVLLGAATGERAGAPIADRFTSGADGGFEFHAPDDAMLEARHHGFAPGRAIVDGAVAVSRELTITLGARGGVVPADLTIAGRVVDRTGAPVVGAEVRATPATRGPDDLRRDGDAVTDDDGGFVVGGLDAGHYYLDARARDLAGGGASAEAGARDVVIELDASASITGTVVDPTGAAVPAATVAVLVRTGLTRQVVAVTSVFDPEGRFTIDGLVAGDYMVMAQAAGFAPSAEVDAVASIAKPLPVTVTVRRGAVLTGVLIDGDSRAPLENGKVTVEGALGEGSTAVPLVTTAITAADGSFELAGIAPGRRSATAGAYRHHMVIVGPFDVAEGARLGPMTIELTPTAEGETPRLELAGIGAALSAEGDTLRVDRVIAGGGAERAGLTAGDLVLAVDGTQVTELGLDGAIQRIRGPVGTVVVLRLRRVSGEADVSVTRTKIRA